MERAKIDTYLAMVDDTEFNIEDGLIGYVASDGNFHFLEVEVPRSQIPALIDYLKSWYVPCAEKSTT